MGTNNSRKPYAFIAVGCAFLFFVASIIWYANREVDITLNGADAKARINSSIEQLIEDQQLEPTPGNLLAVDDSVLKKEGGERVSSSSTASVSAQMTWSRPSCSRVTR